MVTAISSKSYSVELFYPIFSSQLIRLYFQTRSPPHNELKEGSQSTGQFSIYEYFSDPLLGSYAIVQYFRPSRERVVYVQDL